MSIFYISTVVRSAPQDKGGEIIKYDWDKDRILNRNWIYPKDPPVLDPNPRGGSRGGRGIVMIEEFIYVATYHSIEVFDLSLNHLRTINNKNFVGLHEIETDGKRLFCTSTAIDTLIVTDLNGTTIDSFAIRNFSNKLKDRFNLKAIDIDFETDNRLKWLEDDKHVNDPSHIHLNAFCFDENFDRYLISGHSKGVIYDLTNDRILYESDEIKGYHNLVFIDGTTLAINDTKNRYIKLFRVDSEKAVLKDSFSILDSRRVNLYFNLSRLYMYSMGALKIKKSHTRPLFLRGMVVHENNIYVGCSPTGLIKFDLEKNKITDSRFLTIDPNHCVHGLVKA